MRNDMYVAGNPGWENAVKRLSFLLLLLAFAGTAFGQRKMAEYMVTAQPGFYIGPYTTYPGNFQMENSLVLDRFDAVGTASTLTLPTSLLRYGIAEWLEVRARVGYTRTRFDFTGGAVVYSAFSALTVGAKVRLTRPGEKLPQVALRAHVGIPRTGSRGAGPTYLAPSLLLATNFPMFGDFLGFIDLGAAWNGIDPQPTYQYAFCMERGLFPQFTAFAEAYGSYSGGQALDHRYDLGAYYAFTPNLQLDLSGGYGLAGDAWSWYVSTGLSFRLVPARNSAKI